MNNLLIIGAGGHSKVVEETAIASKEFDEISFLDDQNKFSSFGAKVLGPLSDYNTRKIKSTYKKSIVAIGDSYIRLKWIKLLNEAGYELPSIIHPCSFISPSALIGKGTVIFAGSVIQTEVEIGDGVIINTSASIDHNSVISDGVHICPGVHIAGNVQVGISSWIGIGSSIIQNLKIGKNVIIGAGSVVINDIPDEIKAAGVPAKKIPSKK